MTVNSKAQRLLCLFLLLTFIGSPFAHGAAAEDKTVRVGWYESSFNTTDAYGRQSGYAYEYQLKIAAYTGWTYEYVTGSWADLMHMLENGEIDLMSDISYTPEREERMLFSSLPMGTEDWFFRFLFCGQQKPAGSFGGAQCRDEQDPGRKPVLQCADV